MKVAESIIAGSGEEGTFRQSEKILSSNMMERLNREIRRRISVVGIFPNEESYARLVTRVNPKFCVNSNSGANRAKFICGGSRLVRLPPY